MGGWEGRREALSWPQPWEWLLSLLSPFGGFPCSSDSKEFACQCKRPGFNPWVRKVPWERKWQPSPVFLPGKFHGQRSLVGYSPWGHKESEHAQMSPLNFCLHFKIWLLIDSFSFLLNPTKVRQGYIFLGGKKEKTLQMATHSSILAWRIPWTEKPGRLQSIGSKESDTTEQLTLLHRYD